MPIDHRGLAITFAFWLEGLVLTAIAPLLIFPSLLPIGTALALLALPILWISPRLRGRPLLPVTPFNLVLLLWSLALLVGLLVTADPDLTLPKVTGLLLGFAVWRFFALHVRNQSQLWLGIAAFFLVGAGFLFIGTVGAEWRVKVPVLQALIDVLPDRLIDLPGAPEDGIQMNQLGGTILFYLPLLASGLLGWVSLRRRLHTLLLLLAAVFLTLLLLLTQSRSAWLGAAAGGPAILMMWGMILPPSRKRKLIWLNLLLLLVILAAGLLVIGPERLQTLWLDPPRETPFGQLNTLNFRKEVWSWAVVAISDFPFTGLGLGAFRQVVRRLYPIAIHPGFDIAHAHNIFLQVALDVGLPGLVAYLALLGIAAVTGWRVARRSPALRPLALGLLASLVAVHVYGLTDALAPGSKSAVAFWMILGLLTAMERLSRERTSSPC